MTRFLTVTITAPARERRQDRPAAHVALVLDRSGSMAGSKMDMARRAVEHAVRLLDARDRLALVCYDTEIDTLLGATAATAEARTLALRRLARIDARGGTDLCGGWMRGAEEIGADVTADVVRRVLLLSDGRANQGETDADALAQRAALLRAKGLATTTFGIGADFDEVLMSRLATEGGGNFYYIEHPAQIPDFLTSELGETLDIVAANAQLVVQGDGVEVACLGGFVADAGDDTGTGRQALRVRLGDLVSEQETTVVLAVRVAATELDTTPSVALRLTDRHDALFTGVLPVEWTVVTEQADAAQPVACDVLESVASVLAEQARTSALEANRRGDIDEASAILVRAAQQIRMLAPGAPGGAVLDRIAAELEGEQRDYSMVMSTLELKARYFASHSLSMGRTREGRASKKPRTMA